MSRIFITGVSGFAGAGLVGYLHAKEGVTLFGHSRDPEKTSRQFKDFAIEIRRECSAALFDALEIDTVIHLAGIAHDLSNQYKEEDYYRVNDGNTRTVYNEFLQSKARKFIFLSSIKAAVDIASVPADETVVCEPVTPYGRSKRQAEQYIQAQELPADKKFYILRPCMIHGAGNKGNLNLLYRYVRSGVPYPLGAFTNQRSFLNADNFNFILLQFIREDIESGIYHLADQGFLSTSELFRLIATASGKKPRIWNMPRGLIRLMFRLVSRTKMLDKLTENMMVSNEKLLKHLRAPLPVSIREGVIKTIQSFHKQ
jgi:nucleoside-diphosphate-sugar epimerase